jgi:hypothetical protein
MPENWAAGFTRHTVTLQAGGTFTVAAQAGSAAYGQLTSPAGNAIVEADLTTGKLRTIAPVAADAGGLGSMAIDPPWIVWEQLDSQTNLTEWSIHAWNKATGIESTLADSRLAGGGFVPGQQPLPVVSHASAAWAQPTPGTAGRPRSELRVVDLRTAKVSILDSGRVSSPVYAGRNLVWGKIGESGSYTLEAADAITLKPVKLPDSLRRPGSVGYLAGSPGYLVWSSDDYTNLRVWRVATNRRYDIIYPDTRHPYQFLQLAGNFVLWYTGALFSVMDLRTGATIDIQGTVAASPNRIVRAETASTTTTRTGLTASGVSSLKISEASAIGGCAK